MSSRSRRRTTGPKQRDVKNIGDLTAYLNRGIARGKGVRLFNRKRKKAGFLGGGINLGRASRQLARMGKSGR